MTYSIGFRAPARAELAQELLVRLSEDAAEDEQVQMYRDAKQEAVAEPGAIPAELQAFAKEALGVPCRSLWPWSAPLGNT